MKKSFLLLYIFLSVQLFAQHNKYWIKFKDKNHNTFSLANPQQFLSQQSIDRRTRQNISLDSSDLPLTKSYVEGVTPFITQLNHRLKWSNLIVVEIDDAGYNQTDITQKADTLYQTDSASITIHDSIITYNHVNVSLTGISYPTTVTVLSDTIFDTIPHLGPIVFRDSIFLTDAATGNKFDSIRNLPFVDSIGVIATIPPRRMLFGNNKFEEVYPLNQSIVYPNKYGAAYRQINMLNADLLHQLGFKGSGITISMMDNGFYQANQNPAFDSVRSRILGTWDFVHNQADVYGANAGIHGETTFSCMAANMPGKFIGTAPDANFYLLETEDNDAEWVMEEYNWAAAAEFADSAGAQIFSTSLGYTTFDNGIGSHTYSDLTGDKTVITHAGNVAFGKGILVLNSAGNEGANSWHYISAPADGDSILAIGAVDSAEEVTNFSGRGPNAAGRIKPDICAEGGNNSVVNTDASIGISSGTSFSCPIMAGCAASLWSAFPNKTAREIKDAIVISADHFWTPDNNHGYGIPNFYNAYLLLKTNYNDKILVEGNDVVVYPNPFTNELNVCAYGAQAGTHKIEIFDLQGRKVYSKDFFIRDNTFELFTTDELNSLSAGVYILRYDGDKKLSHRIIKIK